MRGLTRLLTMAVTIVFAVPPAGAQAPLVVPARVLERSEPPFPDAARSDGVEGDVTFRATVTTTGQVQGIEILSVPRPGLGFEEAVTATVQRWRFAPAMLRGTAVESTYGGTLRFSLQLVGQAMYAASSSDTWKAVQDLFRQLKIPVEKKEDRDQIVTSGRVRYLALPLPDATTLDLPPGFYPERMTLNVYVTPGLEPARVAVSSVTELEPLASSDTRHYTSYGLDVVATGMLKELARRMGVRMETLSATAEGRAAQARALMPAGLTDRCSTVPSSSVERPPAGAKAVVVAPRKVYHLAPMFPRDQLEARQVGLVIFRAEITEHGTLINPKMIAPVGMPSSFAVAAQLAVGQWRFAPTVINGCPARVQGTFTVQFSLK